MLVTRGKRVDFGLRKWKTMRPNVAQFYGVHANVMCQAQTSGAGDEVTSLKWMDNEVPKFGAKKKDAKRYKTYESSLFNTKSGDGSINLNVDAGDDEEDEVQELERLMGRDKAKRSNKKRAGSSGDRHQV
ncbi:hypothetical protein Tco_0977349 [Tanacetum coccineum]|uniref:Uncharacterized protein n=1 Tax=Tanacetum coccineum TaxID=301880 RepID=A0ABQ5EKY4_9ASTR